MITLDQLRALTALQADDPSLWDPHTVHEAYMTQALRCLTHAIEGTWTFEQTRDAISEMKP